MGQAFKEAFSGYSILGLLIAGIVLGFLAKLLMPGKQNIPWWLTIVAGILGALVGNVLAALFGVRETAGFDWIRHGLQVVGAIGVVALAVALWSKSKGGTAART
ncbi:transglycosylase associated protein [Herbihabitans rhizosphaerae]|uniref:Transglycosylase associated protein n=1 Tax=Herbihabitans rhizosphaerae TaxID=1872711 RepID=A0A4Q7KMW7_9PSEU|nr:GlsB/YeaQ/YmgE family stress response membrane protein [Herbihabitans rhizosphaerae]RZS37825.1 transglycosylase associated protein [Herbihabitans rhizosphaerae]